MLKRRLLVAFAILVTLGLMTQVVAFARPQQPDNPSEKNLQTKKSSKKKKKKKKTVAAVPYLFVPQDVTGPTEQVNSVVVKSVDVTPATPATPTTRNVSRATRTPGIRVTPSGVQPTQLANAGQLIISEFRVRGPNGAEDEFIEIYNNSGAAHLVTASSGTGYGIAASDGVTR